MWRQLFLICIVFIFRSSRANLLIIDQTMSRMVELTTKAPFCQIYTDRGIISNMVMVADERRVRKMSDAEIEKLENICRKRELSTSYQGGFIYPGTKWCGPGTVAKNFSDLGNHRKEDMCCREHDNCPNFLSQGECRQGICNTSPFTRSHCDCDDVFRRCLQNLSTETANTIGAIFFNVVQVICFKERSPCSQWQRSSKEIDIEDSEDYNSIDLIPFQMIRNCSIKFKTSGRFMASPVVFRWRTKGEIIETYLNKVLRKLRLL